MMRVWGLIAASLLSACALWPSQESSVPPASAERIQADWRFLASDITEGRMTATPGYRIAAEYVASRFEAMGLEPGMGSSYFQPVQFAVSSIDADRSEVLLHRGDTATALEWKSEWIAAADVLRKHTHVRAPVVFVGYGVHAPEQGHDDYAGLDVEGKIVAMLLGAPNSLPAEPQAYYSAPVTKTAMAAAQGAIGTVVVRDAHVAEKYTWEQVARNAGRVPSMRWVAEDGSAANYHPEIQGDIVLSESAAQELFRGAAQSHAEVLAADKAGEPLQGFPLAVELEIDKYGSVSRQTSSNVVGRLPGSDPELAEETVVLTAHLDGLGVGAPVDGDEIYNGAYDNALGVAIQLETARLLSETLPPPKRSILVVAVTAEERFLLGSDYFAQHPPIPAEQMVAAINLDNPLFLFPMSEMVAYGSGLSSLGPMVQRAAAAEGVTLVPDPNPEDVIFIRSDQYSFVKQGVPSLFLKPGQHAADPQIDGPAVVLAHRRQHYHQPSDDLSQPVDWDSVTRLTRINARLSSAIASSADRPQWHPDNFFARRFGRAAAAPAP